VTKSRWAGLVVVAALAVTTFSAATASASPPRHPRQEVPAKKRKHSTKATTTTAAKKASLPTDACKLLTTQEVEPLVTGTNPGTSATTSPGPNEVVCRWETETTLQDVVVTVTQLPSSVPSSQLKLSLQVEGKDQGNKIVSGFGDVAIVTSSIPADADVKVLSGHTLLDVDYMSDNPLASTRQDDVVALAKLAYGRM
jgi:hypothetical protein